MSPDADLPDPAATSLRSRMRLAAACALLVGLALVQSPGLQVSDTKFDLVVDPAGFLGRSLHLWDPEGAFGQLQNQAYGYLWPMGPFFAAGEVLDVPGWVVQRLWLALILCVAFLGAAVLARLLGVRSDLACLVAGFAYALSPRMLTTLGTISIEAWPSALAPWVLIPLVIGSQRGSARRAAAGAALAVAMVGGVNAVATFAVIPLGVVWLLTRTPGPRRRQLMFWWPVFTLLGTAWWLVPLLIMGTYSPPFLDYIEVAANTTIPTTLFDSLRGTSNWVAYIGSDMRAGNDLLREPYLIVNSGVLLVFGLWGIAQRGNPYRLFALTGVALGLFLVTMGHLGPVQGWLAPQLNSLLDGALAPLRNVHKFDPIVRLPMVLGVAWWVDDMVRRLRSLERGSGDRASAVMSRVQRTVLTGAVVLAVLGAAMPAVAGRITPQGATLGIPDYWRAAASYVGDRDGTTLVVPGSSFADYVWGSPNDEPMQSLATGRWAIRNAVPLASAGNIRMLDAVEARLSQGRGSPGLATYLRRAGVNQLLVRNDLEVSSDVPDPVLVHQALADSPGIVRVASFGPQVGGPGFLTETDLGRRLVNGGWRASNPAIEVYAVLGATDRASAADDVPLVVGGPEDLLDLDDLGVLGGQPTRLAADLGDEELPSGPRILTDGLRAAERHFGRNHDGSSQTLAPSDPLRMDKPTRDYQMDDDDRWSTTARYDGIASVTASSSLADATAVGPTQRGSLPFAAIDGDLETAWRANRANGTDWWQVDFTEPRPLTNVRITAGSGSRERVQVRTSGGVQEPVVIPAGGSRTVRVGDPEAAWLRIEDVSGGDDASRLTLAEVVVQGLSAQRTLVLPEVPADWGAPDTVVLRAGQDARTGCVEIESSVRCVEDRSVASEEPHGFRRAFGLPAPAEYDAALTVRADAGPAFDDILLQGQPAGIRASSTGIDDPRASAVAAVDGDPGTTWSASLTDLRPTIELNWLRKRRVRALDLSVHVASAARRPQQLRLTWPGGEQTVDVSASGRVYLESFRTDRLTITVLEADPATDLDLGGAPNAVPIGISELKILGVPEYPIRIPRQPVDLPCGSGPTVTVGSLLAETSLTLDPYDVYRGGTANAELCGVDRLALAAGEQVVEVARGDSAFDPVSLVLSQAPPVAPSVRPLRAEDAGAVEVTVDPPGDAELVVLHQNANPGWEPRQGGELLDSVVVDGWQLGMVPVAADEPIDLVFGPDRGYRWGLLGGLAALVLLAVVAVAWSRRWPATPGSLRSATAPRGVLAVGSVLAGGLLAGTAGALVVAVGLVAGVVLRRRAAGVLEPVTAGLVLLATLAYVFRPWGGAAGWAGVLGWPHYLVVASLGVVAGVVLAEPRGRRRDRPRRFLSRIPGFSTSR